MMTALWDDGRLRALRLEPQQVGQASGRRRPGPDPQEIAAREAVAGSSVSFPGS